MKFLNKSILILFLLIPFLKPADYVIGNIIDSVWNIYKVFVIIFILLLYLKNFKKSKIIILISLLQCVFVLSTAINENYSVLISQVVESISIISLCMLTEMSIKVDSKNFFKTITLYTTFFVIINNLSMLIYYPTGMFTDGSGDCNYYFFGIDNASFFHIFPSILYAVIYSFCYNEKFKKYTIFIIVFTLFSYLRVWSVTSFIILFIFSIFLIIMKFIKKQKIWNNLLNFKNYLIAIISLSIFILSNLFQKVFKTFMKIILNKEGTILSRVRIWNSTFFEISKKPIFGHGLEESAITKLKIVANHPHNIVLDILYRGGIAAFIIFCLIVRECYINLMMYKNTLISKILSIGLFLILLASQFDYYNNKYFIFTIYVLCASLPFIIKDLNEVVE